MENLEAEDQDIQFLQERRNLRLNKRANPVGEQVAGDALEVQTKRRRTGAEFDRVTAPGSLKSLGIVAVPSLPPVNRHVELWHGTEAGGGNSYYKAFEINLALAKGDEANEYERCAYYAGALACIIPSLNDTVYKACTLMGCAVDWRLVPRDLPEIAHLGLDEMSKTIDASQAAVMWALIVFMLYKNPTAVNFEDFCRKRMRAMINVGGVLNTDELEVFRDLEDAQNFRKTFGQNHILRREVLRCVLTLGNAYGPLSQVGHYIRSILQWTDLAGYYFVFQTLVMTNSPLLEHPDLVSEVRQYTLATKELAKVDIPAYYRILEDPANYSNFERQKFPTLIAVARELKTKTTKTASQFVTTASNADAYISKLVTIHNNMRIPILNARHERDVHLLTQEGYRDYEE